MKIAAFPRCYMEDISEGRMSIFDWISLASQLEVDGLEMYHRFFASLDAGYLDSVCRALAEHSFEMPMLCASPDFTNPDATERKRAIEKHLELIGVARQLGGPGTSLRVLSGQRHPGVRVHARLVRA